jgi:hypothetical protein
MGTGGIIVIAASAVAVAGIIAWAVVATAHVLAREKTRREIMAYIAEGTISPQDAARLIELSEESELRKKVLDTAAWDWDTESWHRAVDKVFDGKGPPAKPDAAKAAAPA